MKRVLKIAAVLVAFMKVIRDIFQILEPHFHNMSHTDIAELYRLKQKVFVLHKDAVSTSSGKPTKNEARALERRFKKVELSITRWHRRAIKAISNEKRHNKLAMHA
jgi:hypothetical protein